MEVKDDRVQMQETVYIDSIFLLNLVMDLYLLMLTAKMLGKTATYLRIFAGSITGAAGYCIVLCIPGIPYAVKVVLGMIPTGLLMIKIACCTKGIRELLRATGYLYLFSFFLGGFILFLKGKLPVFRKYESSILLLLFWGFAGYAICNRGIARYREKRKNCFCNVSLIGDTGPIEVRALIDTGNGLVEPVSRKPVAILDEEVWNHMKLWKRPEKYKMIPYHSIGRDRGLLEGYVIDSMEVKGETQNKQYENVVVAIFKGNVSGKGGYQMILPPGLSV